VSLTDRCAFRCQYCTAAEGVARFDLDRVLRFERIIDFVRVVQSQWPLAKVHLTGGEPLDRKGIAEFVHMLAGEAVGDMAMTTNGQRLSEFAADLKAAGLRRVNVSLNSLQGPTFREITGGGEVGRTLAGIESALGAGFSSVKINTVVLRGANDHEVCDLARFGMARGAAVRFIELMPMGPLARRHGDCFVSSAEVLGRLRQEFDLRLLPRQTGSSTQEYRVCDASGKSGVVGVISPCSQPFCGDCNRLRLTAGGELIGCLAQGGGVDIRSALDGDGGTPRREEILETIRAVMGRKRCGQGFSSDWCMAKVGG
jgi:cyclic pyranopterin phosphate synthase